MSKDEQLLARFEGELQQLVGQDLRDIEYDGFGLFLHFGGFREDYDCYSLSLFGVWNLKNNDEVLGTYFRGKNHDDKLRENLYRIDFQDVKCVTLLPNKWTLRLDFDNDHRLNIFHISNYVSFYFGVSKSIVLGHRTFAQRHGYRIYEGELVVDVFSSE